MPTPETLLLCAAVAYGLAVFLLALPTGKPLQTLAVFAGVGLAALAAVDLTRPLTGFFLPVNPCTVGASAAGGLPAVIGMTLLRLLFQF